MLPVLDTRMVRTFKTPSAHWRGVVGNTYSACRRCHPRGALNATPALDTLLRVG